MEMRVATYRTWRLLKRRVRASLAAELKSTSSPSQGIIKAGKTIVSESRKSSDIDVPHHFQSVPTPARHIPNIHLSPSIAPTECEVFHIGDNVKILDPYDGAIGGIGRIQSLALIHGVPLGPEDVNINVINVTSNIPLAYEDTIDGFGHLKET